MTEAFALVLHSHLPYARGAGRWPHGEEWVHEAILGTYLPLLGLLHDLRESGVPYQMTIGLTPTLIEQLADRDIDARFIEYCDDQIHRADTDIRRFVDDGNTERGSIARFYASLYRAHRDAYLRRFDRDLVGAFASLARTGHVEILTSAATHGYLPLLDRASVHAQLAVGTRTTRRLLGVEPRGIWLPECAYAPGLEDILETHGLTHFFTDAALLGGKRLVKEGHTFERERSGGGLDAPLIAAADDTLRPYLVRESNVVAIARHDKVSGQVWSAMMGYPGEAAYREFHRKDDRHSASRNTSGGARQASASISSRARGARTTTIRPGRTSAPPGCGAISHGWPARWATSVRRGRPIRFGCAPRVRPRVSCCSHSPAIGRSWSRPDRPRITRSSASAVTRSASAVRWSSRAPARARMRSSCAASSAQIIRSRTRTPKTSRQHRAPRWRRSNPSSATRPSVRVRRAFRRAHRSSGLGHLASRRVRRAWRPRQHRAFRRPHPAPRHRPQRARHPRPALPRLPRGPRPRRERRRPRLALLRCAPGRPSRRAHPGRR